MTPERLRVTMAALNAGVRRPAAALPVSAPQPPAASAAVDWDAIVAALNSEAGVSLTSTVEPSSTAAADPFDWGAIVDQLNAEAGLTSPSLIDETSVTATDGLVAADWSDLVEDLNLEAGVTRPEA